MTKEQSIETIRLAKSMLLEFGRELPKADQSYLAFCIAVEALTQLLDSQFDDTWRNAVRKTAAAMITPVPTTPDGETLN